MIKCLNTSLYLENYWDIVMVVASQLESFVIYYFLTLMFLLWMKQKSLWKPY